MWGFVRAAIDKSIFLTDDSLKFAFNYFEKDGKGEITIDDLISIFSGDVQNNELEKLKNMIKNSSNSHDEIIGFGDFCAKSNSPPTVNAPTFASTDIMSPPPPQEFLQAVILIRECFA